MTPAEIRALPKGAKAAYMIGAEAAANSETFMECADDIAEYYGTTFRKMSKPQKAEMSAYYDEATIEESESGIFRIYARNIGELWQGIGSTDSKSEAIDIAMEWGTELVDFEE